MPNTAQLVSPKPRERGAATAHVELLRRIRTLESKSGKVGAGATVTGATITTADSGQRVYLQGPSGPGGAGFFATDPSGNVVISVQPGIGMVLSTGTSVWNRIEWTSAAVVDGFLHVQRFTVVQTGNKVNLEADSPDATSHVSIGPQAINSGGAATQNRAYATVNGVTAILLDGGNNAIFPGGVGAFGKTPPASLPGHPVTLADVITILVNAGFCA